MSPSLDADSTDDGKASMVIQMEDNCTLLPTNILVFTLTLIFLFGTTDGLHLKGTFHSTEFFLFLAKFGFQKTDDNNIESTRGYLYGRLSSKNFNSSDDLDMYLVVVDSQYFVQYYAQRELAGPDRCASMFSDIDTIAWDKFCFPRGQEDFLRRMPCAEGQLCTEELAEPSAVIEGQQFTYHIVDPRQPR